MIVQNPIVRLGAGLLCAVSLVVSAAAQNIPPRDEYTVGVDDILEISVIEPDKMTQTVTVSPDGNIAFPYIGRLYVKGLALSHVQDQIQAMLADGYMQYPVVLVSLIESRSRKFFVYGEVIKPGAYPMEENTTVLRVISIAGGFTKFGSSSRVKVLRPRQDATGYETIKININAVMNGDSDEDIPLRPGDIIVVSQGMF
jgi:polysaccharide biosynthesis/export protein